MCEFTKFLWFVQLFCVEERVKKERPLPLWKSAGVAVRVEVVGEIDGLIF